MIVHLHRIQHKARCGGGCDLGVLGDRQGEAAGRATMCCRVARAMARPLCVQVPRPSSAISTSKRAVAHASMLLVSLSTCIGNVEHHLIDCCKTNTMYAHQGQSGLCLVMVAGHIYALRPP